MTGRRDYPATALGYARDVAAGRLTACEWVRKACRRQLGDLERARTDPSWPYEFNPRPEPVRGRRPLPGPADRICLFVEALPHIKGDWPSRRENLILSPWQVFVLTTVFGWVYKPGSIDPGSGRDLGGRQAPARDLHYPNPLVSGSARRRSLLGAHR